MDSTKRLWLFNFTMFAIFFYVCSSVTPGTIYFESFQRVGHVLHNNYYKDRGLTYKCSENIRVKKLTNPFTVGEGPFWSVDLRSLLFVDGARGTICRYAVHIEELFCAKLAYVENMMRLTSERQENVPEPNVCSRFFAAVHYILSECFACSFSDDTIQSDRGWPCARLLEKEEAIYSFKGREMRATILMDSTFYYLYVHFPPTQTSYFILDISQTVLPLFESALEETIEDEKDDEVARDSQKVGGETAEISTGTITFDSSIHVTFIYTLKCRIGLEILSKIGNSSTPRKNEFCMELINFSIPKEPKVSKKRKTASPTTSSKFVAPSKLYSEIRKMVPIDCNINSKLMGSILFITHETCICKLESEEREWPVMSNYSTEIVELVYQGRKYFFSLLDYKLDFYLIVRNESSNLITAKKIPKIVCPTFKESDVKIDDFRIASLSVWLNALFVSVIDKDLNRGARSSSARSSTSSLVQSW